MLVSRPYIRKRCRYPATCSAYVFLLQDSPIGTPSSQLVAIRKLKLAQHGARMRLDRLDRDRESPCDLFVGIPSSEQSHDLNLNLDIGEIAVVRAG